MRLIRKFIIARRRDDRVKFLVIFIAIAIICLILSANEGVKIYREINKSIDCIVSTDSLEGVTKAQLDTLRKMDGALYAGRIKNEETEFIIQGDEVTFTCVQMSSESAEKLYGIKVTEGKDEMLFGKKSYSKLIRYMGKSNIDTAEYISEDKKCKAKVLQISVDGDTIIHVVDEKNFSEEDNQIIVRFDNADVSGNNIKTLENSKFQVVEKNEYERQQIKLRNSVLKVKYRLMISAISIMSGVLLYMNIRKYKKI